MANENTGGFKFRLTPLDSVDFAQEVLKSKYGEEFHYLGPWGSVLNDDKSFLVSYDSIPDQRILVQVSNFRDKDTRSVSDNYLACRYARETEEFLKSCSEASIGSARVLYMPTMLPLKDSLSVDCPFERFLAESGVFLGATIEVKGSEFLTEDQAKALISSIAESGVECSLSIVSLPDEIFGKLSWEEVRDRIKSSSFVHFATAYCGNGIIEVQFREGYA